MNGRTGVPDQTDGCTPVHKVLAGKTDQWRDVVTGFVVLVGHTEAWSA